MKILFLSDEFPPENLGGSGIVACNIAGGLKNKSHDIFVITVVQDKSKQGEIELDSLKIYKIYSNYHPRWQAYLSLYNPQTVSKVKKIIRNIKPDIVHAHNIHYHLSYHCLKIAKKYSKAVFLTAHDAMLIHYGKLMPKNGNCFYKISVWDQIKEARKRYNPLRNIIIRQYLKYVDKIFTISDSLKRVLEINGIRNIVTIYNGININEWQIDLEKVETFKEKYKVFSKKIIFFGGRLTGEAKGGKQILGVLALARKAMENIVLLVAGKINKYTEEMRAVAKELGLEKNVIFTDWLERDDLKIAYHSANICVTPSIYLDPFNLFNIEAGAAKKPVVGTCFGGTSEIIIDGETGYIVNPNNIELMTEKIIDLLKNPEKAKRFGEQGYKRVKENFSLDKQAKETLKWYRQYSS